MFRMGYQADDAALLKETGVKYILEPFKDSAAQVADMFQGKVKKDEKKAAKKGGTRRRGY
ncbi:hypothetical protein FVR03_00225 [Pontibacter qinzhouensis]|uniref:Uncharacterized protein n=1 Tax=Pontibacter qinzhouensis TaxID=2603253 RepID=A0A5C8KDM5_9BACT|nr:hypothetical protein [Pontibacter qinzhouensis]TXK52835.1 hypothetical protein FVR03_00225 [Pontibacter qinzhouensis]